VIEGQNWPKPTKDTTMKYKLIQFPEGTYGIQRDDGLFRSVREKNLWWSEPTNIRDHCQFNKCKEVKILLDYLNGDFKEVK